VKASKMYLDAKEKEEKAKVNFAFKALGQEAKA